MTSYIRLRQGFFIKNPITFSALIHKANLSPLLQLICKASVNSVSTRRQTIDLLTAYVYFLPETGSLVFAKGWNVQPNPVSK